MRILGIIPSHNEKGAEKIAAISSRFLTKVILIDDGSKIPIKSSKKYSVLRNSANKGKGYCLKLGFEYALKNKYDAVVCLDGDGEHSPEDIPIFIDRLKEKDIVLGQRRGYRSAERSILNKWASIWVRILLPIEDTQCGFIGIRSKLIKKMKLDSEGFSINLEILLEAFKNNARFDSVNINQKIRKISGVKFKDYLEINNLFDAWVIKNYKGLPVKKSRKLILLVASIIGLSAGRIMIWISQKR